METELQLKHITPYLPYELQVFNSKSGGTFTVDGITNVYAEKAFTIVSNNKEYDIDNWPLKPILRPLSDLHKEIWHQGTKIIPFVELAKIVGIGHGIVLDNYVNANEYVYQNEPEYHTEEYLNLYGAKFETGRPNSVAPNCQEFLIIYPPEKRNEGTTYAFITNIHFQHRQHVHGGEFIHPVRNITKVIEKLQELHFDYMGLILSDLAIDVNILN